MTSVSTQEKTLTWELGDLHQISPSSIIRDANDKVGRLVLRLALAFNDLKDTIMLDVFRSSFRNSEAQEVSPHSGQSGGIATHVHRYIGGILNETLKLLSNEIPTTEEPEFTTLLRSLPPNIQGIWRDLIDEARNSPQSTHTTVRAMLASLRNRSSFHYGRELPDSFGKFFSTSTTVFNQAAYYSSGIDMDGTRYYFADAAAQLDYKSTGDDRGRNTDQEVADLARNVNNAFAMLINAFLRTRGGKPSPPLTHGE